MNGGYIGYVLLGENIAYTTKSHKDTVMVVRELTSYISTVSQPPAVPPPVQRVTGSTAPATDNFVPVNRNVNIPVPGPIDMSTVSVPIPSSPQRRCCGRG